MRVLAYLAQCVKKSPQSVACVSLRAVQDDLGLTVARARLACRTLVKQGFVLREARFAPNGGCLENAYRLTPEGRRRLRDYEAAQVAEEV